MANPLLKKAQEFKPRVRVKEREWTADEIELFVLYMQGELAAGHVRHALGIKGSITHYAALALHQGCQKKYVVMRFQRPVRRSAT
jgi:hypothetical protein